MSFKPRPELDTPERRVIEQCCDDCGRHLFYQNANTGCTLCILQDEHGSSWSSLCISVTVRAALQLVFCSRKCASTFFAVTATSETLYGCDMRGFDMRGFD